MSRTVPGDPECVTSLARCLALALTLADVDAASAGGNGGSHWHPVATRTAAIGTSTGARGLAPAAVVVPRGSVLPVANCADDGGSGTLRSVVAGAVHGDTVDLRGLTCSTISLANGAIVVAVDSLHLLGPGRDALTLDADQSYRRVINHTGHGTLTITGLHLANGRAGIGTTSYNASRGGCVYSAGSVFLDHAAVVGCKAGDEAGGVAQGGGLHVAGELQLHHSLVSGNSTNSGIGGSGGFGGGVFVAGALQADYSTISDNATFTLGSIGYGGGVFVLGDTSLFATTISHNFAGHVGGISIAGYAAQATITNSTVSGNSASNIIGGVYSNTPLRVANSTIAFNSAAQQSPTIVTAGGLQVYATAADLQSTIIAGNAAAGFAFDFGIQNGTVSGAHNLIRTASGLLPADTIFEDPQLSTLQDNGGETMTHALTASSPAVDQGNNPRPLSHDQRGAGHARSFGTATDIGAFEVQDVDDDLVFRDGFDDGMPGACCQARRVAPD